MTLTDFALLIQQKWQNLDMNFVFQDFPELIDDSQKGLDRVAKIVNSMRNFARLSDENYFELVDINDLLDEVLIVVNNEIKYVATIEKNFAKRSGIQPAEAMVCLRVCDGVKLNWLR